VVTDSDVGLGLLVVLAGWIRRIVAGDMGLLHGNPDDSRRC